MKILITGSRGFGGGTLGRVAASAGHDVFGLSRAAQPLPDWPGGHVTVDVVSADLAGIIRDYQPDAIFHAAGTASVRTSFAMPMDDLRASLLSWANLLDGVRRSGRQPLILYPSSGAVYGQPAQFPVGEDSELKPISPYGFHKVACELLAQEYTSCFAARIVVCRLFSLFGPHQRRLLVWELFRQFQGPEEVVWLQGTGDETRDYLSGDDMARVALLLMQGKSNDAGYQAINVARGVETRVLDLAQTIGTLVAPQKEVRCRGAHYSGDPERWQANIGRLQAVVPGWSPQPLNEGLANCISAWSRRE